MEGRLRPGDVVGCWEGDDFADFVTFQRLALISHLVNCLSLVCILMQLNDHCSCHFTNSVFKVCIFFQQASSIKSQNSDTPLETEPPLNHNPEGQVTMHKELEIKFKFISPVLSKVVRHSGKRSGRYSLSYHPALTMTALWCWVNLCLAETCLNVWVSD